MEGDSGDEAGVDDLDVAEGGNGTEVEYDGAGGEVGDLVFGKGAGEVFVRWGVEVRVVRVFLFILLLFGFACFGGGVCGAANYFIFCDLFIGLVVVVGES